MTSSKNRILIIVAIVLLACNLVLLGFMFFGKKDNKKNAERGKPLSDFFEKELNFTPEQTQKFRQLRDAHFENLRPYLKEVRKAKDSLFGFMSQPNVSDSIVLNAAENLAQKEKAQELQSYRHFKQVRDLCTEEQKPKFDTLINKLINKTFARPGNKPGSEKNVHKDPGK